ncbi:MAG: YraN family protein [Lachnospiraceae bacterium]|nr:YraN family protein [Lachnospiraceae bacterium]
MNKRKTGWEKEQAAAEFLEGKGYEVLERNYWCTFSEVDIVAREGEYLCFLEIKYRKNDRYGGGEGTISMKKIRKICQCARYYMKEKKIPMDTPVRFDVVFIIGEQIRLIKNAFSYIG